jgi:hypothetical protein
VDDSRIRARFGLPGIPDAPVLQTGLHGSKKPRSYFGIRWQSPFLLFHSSSNLAKIASLSKELISFERIAFLARLFLNWKRW